MSVKIIGFVKGEYICHCDCGRDFKASVKLVTNVAETNIPIEGVSYNGKVVYRAMCCCGQQSKILQSKPDPMLKEGIRADRAANREAAQDQYCKGEYAYRSDR